MNLDDTTIAAGVSKALRLSEPSSQMRLLSCQDCRVIFGVPADMYEQHIAGAGSLFCPRGHTKGVVAAGDCNEDLRLLIFGLLAQNRQLLAECNRARDGLDSSHKQPSPLNEKKELKRRTEILSSRAEHVEYGRCLCPFCGKKLPYSYSLRNHLRRVHPTDVMDLPPSDFVML